MLNYRHTLAESPRFILAGEHEEAVVIERATGRRTVAGDHYGDPQCGVIAPDESWFVTGGEGLVVFTFDAGVQIYRPGPFDVHAMRLETPDSVRVLVDPWSAQNAVWIFWPRTGELRKLHDGPDLRDQPYRQTIEF